MSAMREQSGFRSNMMVGSVEGVGVPTRTYQAHKVDDLRQRLQEAESAAKPAGYTTRQVVRELADDLRTMLRDKNYTVAGVAKFLSNNGVQIGHRTLGQYLRDEGVVERRPTRKRGAKGKAKARVQSPAGAVGSGAGQAPGESSGEASARDDPPVPPPGISARERGLAPVPPMTRPVR